MGPGDSGTGILNCMALGKSPGLSVPYCSLWEVRVKTPVPVSGSSGGVNEIVKGGLALRTCWWLSYQ